MTSCHLILSRPVVSSTVGNCPEADPETERAPPGCPQAGRAGGGLRPEVPRNRPRIPSPGRALGIEYLAVPRGWPDLSNVDMSSERRPSSLPRANNCPIAPDFAE